MIVLKGFNMTAHILARALAKKGLEYQWDKPLEYDYCERTLVGALAISPANTRFLESLFCSLPIKTDVYEMNLYYRGLCGSLKEGLRLQATDLGYESLCGVYALDPLVRSLMSGPSEKESRAREQPPIRHQALAPHEFSKQAFEISTSRDLHDPLSAVASLGFAQQYIVTLCGAKRHAAYQFFDWPHIFGILPMGSYKYCVIWSQNSQRERLEEDLRSRIAPILRDIGVEIDEILEQGDVVPIAAAHTKRYFDDRSALRMGEAAHYLHPLAGQGLNLTLEDFRAFLLLSNEHSFQDRAYFVEKSRYLKNASLVHFCSQIASPYAQFWLPVALALPNHSRWIAKIVADFMQ